MISTISIQSHHAGGSFAKSDKISHERPIFSWNNLKSGSITIHRCRCKNRSTIRSPIHASVENRMDRLKLNSDHLIVITKTYIFKRLFNCLYARPGINFPYFQGKVVLRYLDLGWTFYFFAKIKKPSIPKSVRTDPMKDLIYSFL